MGLKGFDDRLLRARKEKGFTQDDLAARLGVTPQAVSKWERGIGYPDLELLYYISEILDCSADYLLHRDLVKNRLTETNDEAQKKALLHSILAEPLVVEVGNGLISMLTEEYNNQFISIQELRKRMAIQYGILLPVVRIRDNYELGEKVYRILSYNRVLDTDILSDASTFQLICDKVEITVIEHFSTIINRQMVQTLVDNVADQYPSVIHNVIPNKISLSLLQKVLSALVVKRKQIHNLVKIIEILEDEIEYTKDIDKLTDIIIEQIKL
jgi:flagellar biosynthesis component FlhA